MPIPNSKSELLLTLRTEFKKLFEELKTVPLSLSRQETCEGNISVCDIIAYQIGWGKLLVGWYESGKKGMMPELPAKGFKWNQLGDLAKHFYSAHKDKPLNKLTHEFTKTVQRVEEIINENSNKQLYTVGIYNWTGDKWALGRWINVNTSSPYKSARAKIRKWKRTNNL